LCNCYHGHWDDNDRWILNVNWCVSKKVSAILFFNKIQNRQKHSNCKLSHLFYFHSIPWNQMASKSFQAILPLFESHSHSNLFMFRNEMRINENLIWKWRRDKLLVIKR
jgi:hypothetical protein